MSINPKQPSDRGSESRAPEQTGVLGDKRKKDIESEILTTLRKARLNITNRELVDLMNRLEVSQGLDGLRRELERDRSLDDHRISDETVQAVFDLIQEARRIVEARLGELRIDVQALNRSPEYDISPDTYPTHRFAFVQRLEEARLGDNVFLDATGVVIGALDSVEAVFRLLITILLDIVRLPGDLMAPYLQSDRGGKGE